MLQGSSVCCERIIARNSWMSYLRSLRLNHTAAMKHSKRESNRLLPRFRVMHRNEPALGPGKADLLMHIKETGSIGNAAAQLSMSYMRAWRLIQTMNRCFREPLVKRRRGGKTGGGAVLTPTGEQVLKLYRRIEAQSQKATNNTWTKMKSFLK